MPDEFSTALPWDYWRTYPTGNVGEAFDTGLAAVPAGDKPPPVVTVFGAGIAGLSAAHELVERGFTVQVVERAESATDEYECRVGGMAANQLSRVPADIETLHPGVSKPDRDNLRLLRARYMQPSQYRFALTHRIRFARGSSYAPTQLDDYLVPNSAKLQQVHELLRLAVETYRRDYEAAVKREDPTADPKTFLSKQTRCREVLFVEIRGFTDTDKTSEQNRAESQAWADQVLQALLDLNAIDPIPIPDLTEHLIAIGLGDSQPLGDQTSAEARTRSNRVEFRVVEQVIPGEHGFRFFPSCYRHLFDTMRRTPVLDERGQETGETAFDQLVAVRETTLAREDEKGPFDLNPRRLRTVKALLTLASVVLRRIGFTDRDVLCLQVPMLKFLTSCRARREAETENVTFWDYIGGDAVGFSTDAERFIKETPRALAAMSATETDARTQLTLLMQMMIKGPFDEMIDDFTLNGASGDAWFRVWKTYLRRRGVRFFVGEIDDFDDDISNGLLPLVTGPGDWSFPRPEDPNDRFFNPSSTDFFVLAVSFEEASQLVWKAYAKLPPAQFAGPFNQVRQFDMYARRRMSSGQRRDRKRVATTGKPEDSRDPLRDISGIQYFFLNNYRIGRGHVYFIDSKWALTSISQLAYWRDRTQPIGSYIGQHSVDIGDWYKSYPQDTDPTAWHTPRQQIAENTWCQILASLKLSQAEIMLPPKYYHLDHGLQFNVIENVGFIGNVVYHVAAATADSSYAAIVIAEDAGDRVELAVEYTVAPAETPSSVAEALRGKLADLGHGRVVLAIRNGNDVLVSPFWRPRPEQTTIVVAIRGRSAEPFYVATPTARIEVPGVSPGTPLDVAERIHHQRDSLGVSMTLIGPNSLLIKSDEPIAVANSDNQIEIVDGPRLTLRVENRDVHVTRAPQRGTTRVTRVAVRGDARIQVRKPDLGRVYRLSLKAADGRVIPAQYEGVDESEREFRDNFRHALIFAAQQALGPAALPGNIDFPPFDPPPAPPGVPTGFGFVISVPQGSILGPVYELEVKDLTVLAFEELLPVANASPFLINVPRQWRRRPGLFRKPAATDSITVDPGVRAEFDYCHSGPLRRWVAAGTYAATFTRMTTMEAANESARHAVNAILQTIKRTEELPPVFNGQGMLFGDPCDIWDPEENEPADLEYFKRLDAALVDAELPHFLDILKIGELVQKIPQDDGTRLELWDELMDLLMAGGVTTVGIAGQTLQNVVDQLDKLTGKGGI